MTPKPEPWNAQQALAGLGILVTRPVHQAGPLCALIEAAGGRAVRFPTVEILPVSNRPAALECLERYDLAVFVSPNAVAHAAALLRGRDWPAQLRRAAVGAGTARALAEHGWPAHIVPAGRFDSEALLEQPALHDVAGQRIVIVRGVGGRELLGETLRARGAQVDYAEVYRRTRPQADPAALLRAWACGDIDVVTATSADALRNLVEMLGADGRALVLRTPLVVVSARMIQLASELGFVHVPRLADGADAAALIAALSAWRRGITAGEPE